MSEQDKINLRFLIKLMMRLEERQRKEDVCRSNVNASSEDLHRVRDVVLRDTDWKNLSQSEED